jgi:hypothetical protein
MHVFRTDCPLINTLYGKRESGKQCQKVKCLQLQLSSVLARVVFVVFVLRIF